MIIYIPGEIKTITEFVLSELVDDLHHSLNINHERPPVTIELNIIILLTLLRLVTSQYIMNNVTKRNISYREGFTDCHRFFGVCSKNVHFWTF